MRIALTGTHGVGKTWIMDQMEQAYKDQFHTVTRIESPTRYIKSLGYENNETTDFRMQLLSGTERVVRQKEALKLPTDMVLADRCLLDEVAYTRFAWGRTLSDDRLNKTQDLLMDLFMDDINSQYWDAIYLKPLHPDYPPEDDGDRSESIDFQKGVEDELKNLIIAHRLPIRVLPLDREEALAVLKKEWDLD